MDATLNLKSVVYLVGIVGCALALAAAVVPHYGHHKLAFAVLLTGVLPYATLLVLAEIGLHRSAVLPSLAVLGVDALVKLILRFSADGQYENATIYLVPVAATIAIAALAYRYRRNVPTTSEPARER